MKRFTMWKLDRVPCKMCIRDRLIVGGSGAGKTRYFCLPNVMNACCSYIITDCKGEILRAVGGLFEKQGIPFTVLDLVNMRGHYNPFAYLRRDSDALRLVTNLVANTTPKDAKNSDPFWDRAVSYTHLDVYKRQCQAYPRSRPASFRISVPV